MLTADSFGQARRGTAILDAIAAGSIESTLRRWLDARGGGRDIVCRPLDVRRRLEDEPIAYELTWRDANELDGPLHQRRVTAHFGVDGAAQRSHAAASALWRAGFDGRNGVAVVEPLGYCPSVGCRLEGELRGTTLSELIESDDEDARAGAEMAGVWLARLHDSDVGGAMRTSRDDRLEIERSIDIVAALFPGHGTRLDNLGHALSARLGGARPLVPTHGDYRARNIVIAADRVTAIGFDRFAVAEPARDVGRFLADGLSSALLGNTSLPSLSARNRSFLAGYQRGGGNGSLGRVAIWTGVGLVHLLAEHALAGRMQPSYLPGWLTLCERPLAA